MLVPKVDLKEFEKFGFKKCKGDYGQSGCYYLCIAKNKLMFFVSKVCFKIFDWDENDPRIHARPNCRYSDKRDWYDILYDMIKADMIKSDKEEIDKDLINRMNKVGG